MKPKLEHDLEVADIAGPEFIPAIVAAAPLLSYVTDPSDTADWVALVERIQDGTTSGMEELYGLFSKGIRFYLCRQLGAQELEDKIHDTFLLVVQAIRRGELREPDRLMGFVRTIVRRKVAGHLERPGP